MNVDVIIGGRPRLKIVQIFVFVYAEVRVEEQKKMRRFVEAMRASREDDDQSDETPSYASLMAQRATKLAVAQGFRDLVACWESEKRRARAAIEAVRC